MRTVAQFQEGKLLNRVAPGFLKLLMLSGSLCMLSGCSQRIMIGALEDVNTERDDGLAGILSNMDQTRTINVSGALPFTSIGQMYRMPMGRHPSMALPMSSDGKSYIVEILYESQSDLEDLKAIRSKLLLLRKVGEEYLLALLELRIAQNERAAINKIEPNERREEQITRLEELKAAIPRKEIKVQRQSSDLVGAEQAAYGAMAKENLIVFDWKAVKESGWSVLLSSIGNLRWSGSEERSGYAVVSGLRITYLETGSDIWTAFDDANLSWFNYKRPITTQLWQAKYVMSLSTFESTQNIASTVKASYRELANIPETIKEIDRIEIEQTLRRITALSNISTLSTPKIEREEFCWVDKQAKRNSTQFDKLHANTLFTVHTYYRDLRKLFSRSAPKDSHFAD